MLVAVLVAVTSLPLIYRDGVVEGDSICMSYGIAHAIRSGEGLRARDLYGRTFSFGYYLLFIELYPRLFESFEPLIACMNGLNLGATAASFVPLILWMSELWGCRVAVAAAALMAATPVLFELGGYGHPEGPAFLFLNLALYLFLRGRRPGTRHAGLLTVSAAVAAFTAAVLRADVIFAFPLLPFLAPLVAGPGRRRRGAALGAAVALVAMLGFFAAQAHIVAMMPPRIPVPGGEASGPATLTSIVVSYWRVAKEVRTLPKGVVVWALGLGPLLLGLGLAGVVAVFRRGERIFGLACLALLVPNGAFWLPDPTPPRHLLMTFLVLAPAAALLVGSCVPRRRFAPAVAALVALNLASMALAYPVVVRSYPFHFTNLLPRRVLLTVPLGDPITNRMWTCREVALETAEARQMAATEEPRLLAIGSATAYRLMYEIIAFSPRYAIEYEWRHGAFLRRVVTPRTEYVVYESTGSAGVEPAEFMARVAKAEDFRDFAVAIAPTDQPAAAPAVVPPGYREFRFDLQKGLELAH